MKIVPCEDNKEKLIELWMNVFGDEREYIELLFSYGKTICDVFAVSDEDKIISVLYLLNCDLTFKGKNYKGKYLYAAATDEKHRGKGLMALLIEEAQLFCKSSAVDFISLVPANEKLYSYYEKFGFITAMHRATVFGTSERIVCSKYDISGIDYFTERSKKLTDCISFSIDSIEYVISCLKYSGLKFCKNADGQLFLYEENSLMLDELINENSAVRYVIVNDETEKKRISEKFGMLYPINNDLKTDWKFTDLYMNIALD